MNDSRVLFIGAYPRRMGRQQAATRVDGRLLGLIVGLLALAAAAGLLYLSQASAAAQLQYRLCAAEACQAELWQEIALLRCRIATADTYASLEARAARLRLVDAPSGGPYLVCDVSPAQATGPASEAGRAVAAQALGPIAALARPSARQASGAAY
mgnify:CR=1 FL=1